MTDTFRRRWLVVASLLVATYATMLVIAGPVAARLFDVLGFGPLAAGVPEGGPHDYVMFVYGVLGAVLVGWMVTIAGVTVLAARAGEARAVVAASLGVWFLLDTGLSLALGAWRHAVFNVAFLALLGVPLLPKRPREPAAGHAAD